MFKKFWNSLKIISASSLLLSGSFLIKHDVAMAGEFLQTCGSISYAISSNNVSLTGVCRDRAGNNHTSTLHISDDIANYDGSLQWAPQGDFVASCRDISFYFFNGTLYLAAICRSRAGYDVPTTIDLNSRISNQNGVLAPDF